MNLNILNCLTLETGDHRHMRADLHLHKVIGLHHLWCTHLLTNLNSGPLLILSKDTHPLGIGPIPLSQGLIFQHIGLAHMSLGHTIRSVHIHMLGSDLYIQPLREIMDIETLIPMTASLKASRLKRQTLMVNWTQPNFLIGWQTWTTILSGMICLMSEESDLLR